MLSLIHQQLFRRHLQAWAHPIAESIGDWLQHCKRSSVRLCLAGIHATGSERHHHAVASHGCGLFNANTPGQHDQIGERHPLAITAVCLESLLNALQHGQHPVELSGTVHVPAALWGQTESCTVGASALIGAPEAGG